MTLREQLLAVDDLKRERVDIPEWNTAVYVRAMTAGEREQWEGEYEEVKSRCEVRATLAAMVVVDADGARIFTDDDVEALSRKSAAALDRILEATLNLSKVSQRDRDDLEKKSLATNGSV